MFYTTAVISTSKYHNDTHGPDTGNIPGTFVSCSDNFAKADAKKAGALLQELIVRCCHRRVYGMSHPNAVLLEEKWLLFVVRGYEF